MKKIFFLVLFFSFVLSFDLNCWTIKKVINVTGEYIKVHKCSSGRLQTWDIDEKIRSEFLLDFSLISFVPASGIFNEDGSLAIKYYLMFEVGNEKKFVLVADSIFDMNTQDLSQKLSSEGVEEGNLIISINCFGQVNFTIQVIIR